MRVLFLYPRPLDANRSVGGVAEFLCSLTPKLKTLNIDSVIYAGDKTVNQLTEPADVIIDAKVYNGPFIRPSWFISNRKLAPVLEVCRKEKIDLIHAQGTYRAGFMAWEIHKRTNIPYVITSHSDILPTNSLRMRRGNVKRRCKKILKDAAAVTHLTPIMENFSHEIYDTREKSTVIGNGINYQSWIPYANHSERDYILSLGRLERGKGFNILIDMYAKLLERGVKTPLVIAGKGTNENEFFVRTKALNINLVTDFTDFDNFPERSIIFTGYVRDEAKMRLIAESKILLFGTQPHIWEEAFGLVQLEAMAAGKSIIASDTNVTRFLNKCGMQCCIVEPANINDWAEQTYCLLNNAESRKQMGESNLHAVTQFGWEPIAKQYSDVYTRVSQK